VTPETAALLAFDLDEALRSAVGRSLPSPSALSAARRRNRAAAFLYLRNAAARGVTSEDPKSEALIAAFRRDALREAGVDERLVRRGVA